MGVAFVPVETEEEINRLAGLADEIWHEYFTAILSESQIDYMVDKFQSFHALCKQIKEDGYEYYFICVDGKEAGFTGIREEKENKRLFLSKLYLLKRERKKGYASAAFEFLKHLCGERDLNTIYLTVNRHNDDTIAVYRKKGFEVVKEQVTDIGGGYVMDDYVMRLAV